MKKMLYVRSMIFLYLLLFSLCYGSYMQYYLQDRGVFFDALDRGYLLSNGVLAVTGVVSLQDGSGSIIPGSSMLFYGTTTGDTTLLFSRWKFGVPDGIEGQFTDATLADVDGDGLLEYIGILNITEAKTTFSDKWLYIFKQSGASFGKKPWIVEGFTGSFPVRPRPAHVIPIDVDSNGDEELIVSFFGPYKGISILDYMEDAGDGKIVIKTNISGLEQFNSILPFCTLIGVVPGERNRVVLTVIGGIETLEISFVDFLSGEVAKNYNFKHINISDVDITKIRNGDIDGDGIEEILIPLKTGGALLLFFEEGDSLKHGMLFPDVIHIKSLCMGDFNFNGLDEIVINYGDVSKLVGYEYDEIGSVQDISSYRKTIFTEEPFIDFQFVDIKPVLTPRKGRTGQIIVPFINNVTKRVGITLWQLSGEALERFLSAERTDREKEEKEGITKVSKLKPFEYAVPARKSIRKPDILLHPGESMKRKLEIPGFNFNNLRNLQISIDSPSGMIFDLSTQTFYWTPSDTQLGWYNINAFFSWDNGSVEEHFTVYVNSPPEVETLIPEKDVIQTGETFRKKIEVVDGNIDSEIFFDLIKHPEGAVVTGDGELVWKPDESQKDWHEFILQITDGYDSTTISFSLFVNHPVKIISEAPSIAHLGEKYVYDVQFSDRNKGFFTAKYDHVPYIEDWQTVVVAEIPISSVDFITRMKTYAKKFNEMLSNEAFKSNYQKASVRGIKEVVVDEDKLVFLIEKDRISQLSASKILEIFCRVLNVPRPEHSNWNLRSLYEFELKNAPEGMTIDGWGRISWIPDKFQCGHQNFSLIVSDGYFMDEEKIEVYVNAPPEIVSSPDSVAFVGKEWTYAVKVKDLNDDARLTFSLISPPEGMEISKNGVIRWTPTEKQLNHRVFEVEVSDGYKQHKQRVRVYVNMPPIVLSSPEPVGMVGLKYQYKLDVEDPNGNPIKYQVVRLPKYAEFDPVTGILSWTPRSSQIGTNHIIFEISDNYGGKTVHEFDIRVFKNPSKSWFSYLKDGILILSLIGLLYFALGSY